MPRLPAALALALACWLLPAWAAAQTLTVAADSSLAEAVREIAQRFEAAHAGSQVKVEAAAAGLLLERLAEGARFDLFASADLDTLARGVDRRLLAAGPPRMLAGNAIVLIVPAAAEHPPQRLSDLARPEVQRIAMGRIASVPAGRHAREAIDTERLWPAVQRKMVFCDSVAQVLELVSRGEVDAGFVYRTDAPAAAGVRVALVPETSTPVRHAAALVAGTKQEALARELLALLAAPASRAAWTQRGYTAP